MKTDQKHANQERNINEGKLAVAVTESAKKYKENQDWTTQTHSVYNKEGNVQLTNKLNTPGIGNARVRKADQNRQDSHQISIQSNVDNYNHIHFKSDIKSFLKTTSQLYNLRNKGTKSGINAWRQCPIGT